MEKKRFALQWPWNWVVCGVFVVVAGYFIGYLWSALLAALFLWIQKKRHPGEVPQGGYCLDRTRKRLARLGWSLLYLVFAAAGGVVFYMQMQEDRAAWEIRDWAYTVFSAVLCLGGGVLCLYETYTDLRDALVPAKSRLAKSIRSQLPRPDEHYTVAELFAMVDRDIEENGLWFDRVAIGKSWVLGDEAASIPRIRGVFPRDEIKVRVSNNRSQSARIVELYLVDDRKQVQCTALRNPDELKAAVSCLRLRAPEAFFADHSRMADFMSRSDHEWQAMDREVCRRQEERLAREAEQERLRDKSGAVYVPGQPAQSPPRSKARLTLSDRTGVTRDYDSFTRRDVELAGEGLTGGQYTVAAYFDGPRYLYLKAEPDGQVTVNASRPGPDRLWVFETKCQGAQARMWLIEMFEGVFAPDFSTWCDITEQLEKTAEK